MRGKQNKYFKLDLRRQRCGRSRNEWEQYIGEISKDKGMELKTLRKMTG